MQKLSIKNKTCFFSKSKDFVIYDSRGVLFYSPTFVNKFGGYFTLPKGDYFVEGKIIQVKKKINDHRKIKLKPFERDLKHDWGSFKILFELNPNKATINHKDKTITFDHSFKTQPLYIIFFVLFHEMGHNYYESEYGADMYAVKQMLKAGFTPSQVGMCPLVSLSDRNNARKSHVINNLINSYR